MSCGIALRNSYSESRAVRPRSTAGPLNRISRELPLASLASLTEPFVAVPSCLALYPPPQPPRPSQTRPEAPPPQQSYPP